MRVALLHAFAAEAGGAEAHVGRLHRLLAERGHEIRAWDARAIDGALAPIASFAPDIIHLHNVNGGGTRLQSRLAATGFPIVRTLHDHSLICPAGSLFANGHPCERCTSGRLHHAGLNGCINVPASLGLSLSALLGHWPSTAGIARFLTASPDLAARVRRAGIRTRIDVIGTFVPEREREGPGPSPASTAAPPGRTVVSAGRMVAGKGFDTLLTAVRDLAARVVIIGTGPLFPALAGRVRSEGLSHVTLTGHLTGDDYLRQLRRAALVVLPSEAAEVTPTVVCEAFAAGIPVVASAVDSVPELVGDNQRGVLVPPGDAQTLARAIGGLLNDEPRRQAMRQAALAYARERLSADRYYERLTALYADVVAAHA